MSLGRPQQLEHELTYISCPCCLTEVTGPHAEAALRQHSEACPPLKQLVSQNGQAGLQLALMLGSERARQPVSEAVAQEVASTSISASAAAFEQNLRAARCRLVHAASASASFKSLVSPNTGCRWMRS